MSGELRLMTRAGKTFYFATLWLPKRARYEAALAYNFCRAVDDIADAEPARAGRDDSLRRIAHAVSLKDQREELVKPLIPLLERYPEVVDPFVALVDACREDTADLEINDERDLERYAHGVAGNVGLIMYPILGGASSHGRALAADLGIAMQCTNIARDVREDLRRRRIYLPTQWLGGLTLSDSLDERSLMDSRVIEAVRRLLAFAHERYSRGLSGINYLAPHCRYAIRVAARCYAAIGDRVIQGGTLASERAVVPLSQKIVLACKVGLSSQGNSHLLQESQ